MLGDSRVLYLYIMNEMVSLSKFTVNYESSTRRAMDVSRN